LYNRASKIAGSVPDPAHDAPADTQVGPPRMWRSQPMTRAFGARPRLQPA